MSEFTGKKMIASYSGGKDSMLAIHRAVGLGMIPLGLVTTYNTDAKRSWFHGIPTTVLDAVSASLNIPVTLIKTSGAEYEQSFRQELARQKVLGAQVCIFGDIDLAGHLEWCTRQCQAVGLTACFPLWQEPRAALVYEGIELGYAATITVVDTARLDSRFLGQRLTRPLAEEIAAAGADICGENGEYHTFVWDGPLFRQPVLPRFGQPILRDGHALLPMVETSQK